MIVLHDIKAKSAKKIDGIVSLAMASLRVSTAAAG